MELLKQREQITIVLSNILSEKNFSDKAKSYLFQTFLLIFDHYEPPLYIRTPRDEYVKEYLRILQELKEYKIVELSEINDFNRIAKEFRKDVKRSNNKTGNLEKIDGRYVPALNGSYYCITKGFADLYGKSILTLDEGEYLELLLTCYHEMTHLSEGEKPFPLSSKIPLSFELREMFYEGRAAIRESYLNLNMSKSCFSFLCDEVTEIEIESMFSYPLYEVLYQLLQLIFGVEILEELSHNNDDKLDMFNVLKEQFPEIPVEEIFAHLTYIVNCSKEKYEDKEILRKALLHYRKYKYQQKEKLDNQIRKNKKIVIKTAGQIQEKERKINGLEMMLSNSENLQKSFRYHCQAFKKELEMNLKQGRLSEVQYQKSLLEFKRSATLPNYLEVQKQKLVDLRKELFELQQILEEQLELVRRKKDVEEDQYDMAIKEICFDNPSLRNSFGFLEKIANMSIQREYASLPERKKMEQKAIYDSKRNVLARIIQKVEFVETIRQEKYRKN